MQETGNNCPYKLEPEDTGGKVRPPNLLHQFDTGYEVIKRIGMDDDVCPYLQDSICTLEREFADCPRDDYHTCGYLMSPETMEEEKEDTEVCPFLLGDLCCVRHPAENADCPLNYNDCVRYIKDCQEAAQIGMIHTPVQEPVDVTECMKGIETECCATKTATGILMPAENGVEPDMLDHPEHYTTGNMSGIECWNHYELAMIEDEFRGAMKSNIYKYIFRGRKKGDHKKFIEDLEKVKRYVDRWIEFENGVRVHWTKS